MLRRIAYRLYLVDNFGLTGLGVALSCIGFVVALFAVVFVVVLAIAIPTGRHSCAEWGRATGIRTKFVRTYWADTGTCLAQSPDGRWVGKNRVQVYIPGATVKP